MSTCVPSPSLAAASTRAAATVFRHGTRRAATAPLPSSSHRFHPFLLKATNESSDAELASDGWVERLEADRIVDGMDFGELCNEFECISSPLVESTARQLARDILDLRRADRSLQNFAASVKYKDPVRKFTGREKYKRQLWATTALDNPSVSVQEMAMESTSIVNIKWTMKGKGKSVAAAMGLNLTIKVNSRFTLNQISGQVVEHEEQWDVSDSSAASQAFFWASRYLFASSQAGKDFTDSIKSFATRLSTDKQNLEIFPDPSADPTKFFESEDSFQRDAYQFALLLALLYFLVQFLRTTL